MQPTKTKYHGVYIRKIRKVIKTPTDLKTFNFTNHCVVLNLVSAASDDCADAWRPKQVEVFPGCYYDVGQCLKRSCRSAGSGESCSDNNVCCETTTSVRPDCAMGNLVTKVLRCSCRCQASSFIIVKGTVKDSDTDLPLKGIIVMLVGDTVNTTSDVNGEFSFNSVSSSKRRLVAKASDSEGNYLDNYVVKTILVVNHSTK